MHAHRLLNIVNICRRLGLEPDPWQLDVLRGEHQRLLLNCSRQAGKSTVAALLALVKAMTCATLPSCCCRAASGSRRSCFARSPTSAGGWSRPTSSG